VAKPELKDGEEKATYWDAFHAACGICQRGRLGVSRRDCGGCGRVGSQFTSL